MGKEQFYSTKELVPGIFMPDHFQRNIVQTHEAQLDDTDIQLVDAIVHNNKYRLTAVSFLAYAKPLPPQEKVGIALFVGLVNAADDTIDSSEMPDIPDAATLREYLLAQPLQITDAPLTIGDLYERTLQKFPGHKQDAIESFLQDGLTAQLGTYNRPPGSYSFDEAVDYRRKTSEPYDRTGVTDERAVTHHVAIANTMQALDDVADCVSDYRNDVMNPFVALSFETGENDVLALMSHEIPERRRDEYIGITKTLNAMSNTRRLYADFYTAQYAPMNDGVLKSGYHAIGTHAFA